MLRCVFIVLGSRLEEVLTRIVCGHAWCLVCKCEYLWRFFRMTKRYVTGPAVSVVMRMFVNRVHCQCVVIDSVTIAGMGICAPKLVMERLLVSPVPSISAMVGSLVFVFF